jgi:regulator of RNase E activity RraA
MARRQERRELRARAFVGDLLVGDARELAGRGVVADAAHRASSTG